MPARIWVGLFAVSVLVIDQLTKMIAIDNLAPFTAEPLIGDVVKLYLIYNDSAAFSMGFGITWIFTVISSLAVIGLIIYGRKIKDTSWAIMHGALIGGVAGNLFDRLFRDPGFPNGHVVDFIQIPFDFPVFNIADSAICVVAVIAVIRVMRGENLGGVPAAQK